MVDSVDKATRSRMMAGIKGKDTKPEMAVRKALHAKGFRFRLHKKGLPGRPDIVLAKYKAVVFVHGCFWHMHRCKKFRMPQTRKTFWKKKLEANVRRDATNKKELRRTGWKVYVVWECKTELAVEKLIGGFFRSHRPSSSV